MMSREQEARLAMKAASNVWLLYVLIDVAIIVALAFSKADAEVKLIASLIAFVCLHIALQNWERKTERTYRKLQEYNKALTDCKP